MMKTNLPCLPAHSRPYLRFIAITALLVTTFTAQSQTFKGRDGSESYTITGAYVLNRYTTLASTAMSGALSVTVADMNELSGTHSFTNSVNPYTTSALTRGDLVMIIQMQGADINTNDDADYGAVTNYNGTGHYEVRMVNSVAGNTIFLCGNLQHTYYQQGRSRTQIVRIPRLTSLSISSGANVTGMPWDGVKGGIVAVEANQQIVVNGRISADAIGFRGGTDDINASSASGSAVVTLYRTTATNTAAGKGEGIAGNANDYLTVLQGANGRGAPANAGGGGNGHNSGGGGGSNAGTNGVLNTWNGTGIKDVSGTSWAAAWNLESAGFSSLVSSGGGRGGYSFSNSNQDALTLAPGSSAWGGDKRQIVGGLGGRPLDYAGDTRLFMGGGGGSGDGNNQAAGFGGNGGGIVYLFTNGDVLGSGTISANGQNGYNTKSSNIDAAGGAGGGGAVVVLAAGAIHTVTIQANGGKGGDQLHLTGEAEGPGGGGGGGYIATTSTAVARQVTGGANGISNSTMVSEFLPNGATMGADGTVASQTFREYLVCDENGIVLPAKLSAFEAAGTGSTVQLSWQTESENALAYYEIERSADGVQYTGVGRVEARGFSISKLHYAHTDHIGGTSATVHYYRLKMVDTDGKYTYSAVRRVEIKHEQKELATYPNPVAGTLQLTLPAGWLGKKVQIEVFDMTGKLALRFEKASAGYAEQANMHQLGSGIYLVQATMGNEVARQRVIKK